jgi:hypothetical protein
VKNDNFLLTIFVESPEMEGELRTWFTTRTQYSIAAREICPEIGREHPHIYAEFEDETKYGWMQVMWREFHIDPVKRTA